MNLDLKEYRMNENETDLQISNWGSGKKFSEYNHELLETHEIKLESLLTDRSAKGDAQKSIYSKMIGHGESLNQ